MKTDRTRLGTWSGMLAVTAYGQAVRYCRAQLNGKGGKRSPTCGFGLLTASSRTNSFKLKL